MLICLFFKRTGNHGNLHVLTHSCPTARSSDRPPVNALSQAVRSGLSAGLDRADADPAVSATVIIGGGRTFIAGADIKEFGKPPLAPYLPQEIGRAHV